MPVEYVVLNQGMLVLEWWTGRISHDEVLAHERRHLSDPSVMAAASVLVDAVNASFETTPEMVHEVTDLYRQPLEKLKVRKVALLVNESVHDRARLYERQSMDLGVRAILFNSMDIACTWLGIDVAIVRKELMNLQGHTSPIKAASRPA